MSEAGNEKKKAPFSTGLRILEAGQHTVPIPEGKVVTRVFVLPSLPFHRQSSHSGLTGLVDISEVQVGEELLYQGPPIDASMGLPTFYPVSRSATSKVVVTVERMADGARLDLMLTLEDARSSSSRPSRRSALKKAQTAQIEQATQPEPAAA